MGYATQQDMVDRYAEAELIQLTDRSNTGAINTTVLGQALADADALIDGYLAGRYALPLSTVPVALKRYACDITRYLLHDNAATEEVRSRYEDAKKFLELVSKGSIALGLSSTGGQAVEADGAQMESDTPVFRRGSSTEFI